MILSDIVDHAGWGGYIKVYRLVCPMSSLGRAHVPLQVGKKAAGMIYTNPAISAREALQQMQRIQTFTEATGGTFEQLSFTSYGRFVDEFLGHKIDDILVSADLTLPPSRTADGLCRTDYTFSSWPSRSVVLSPSPRVLSPHNPSKAHKTEINLPSYFSKPTNTPTRK